VDTRHPAFVQPDRLHGFEVEPFQGGVETLIGGENFLFVGHSRSSGERG